METIPSPLLVAALGVVFLVAIVIFLFGARFQNQSRILTALSKCLIIFLMYEGIRDKITWKQNWFSYDFKNTNIPVGIDFNLVGSILVVFWILLGVIWTVKEWTRKDATSAAKHYIFSSDLLSTVGLIITCLSVSSATFIFGVGLIILAISMGSYIFEQETIRDYHSKIAILFSTLMLFGVAFFGLNKELSIYLVESIKDEQQLFLNQIFFILCIWIGLHLFPVKAMFGKFSEMSLVFIFLQFQALLGCVVVVMTCRFLPPIEVGHYWNSVCFLFSLLGLFSLVRSFFSITWIESQFYLFSAICTFAIQMRMLNGQIAALLTLMIAVFINFFIFLGAQISSKKVNEKTERHWKLGVSPHFTWIPGVLICGGLGWSWNIELAFFLEKVQSDPYVFVFSIAQLFFILAGVWNTVFRVRLLESKKVTTAKDNIFHVIVMIFPIITTGVYLNVYQADTSNINAISWITIGLSTVISFLIILWLYSKESSHPHVWIKKYKKADALIENNFFIRDLGIRIEEAVKKFIHLIFSRIIDSFVHLWLPKFITHIFNWSGHFFNYFDSEIISKFRSSLNNSLKITGKSLQLIHNGDIHWYLGLSLVGVAVLMLKYVVGGF